MRNGFDMISLIPLLPLLGCLINGLARNVLSKTVVSIIGCGVLFISFVFSVLVFLHVRGDGFAPEVISYFDFINVGKIKVPFAFQVDQLSSLFLLIITGVGFLIHVYSIGYMKGDDGFVRFFSYMNLQQAINYPVVLSALFINFN